MPTPAAGTCSESVCTPSSAAAFLCFALVAACCTCSCTCRATKKADSAACTRSCRLIAESSLRAHATAAHCARSSGPAVGPSCHAGPRAASAISAASTADMPSTGTSAGGAPFAAALTLSPASMACLRYARATEGTASSTSVGRQPARCVAGAAGSCAIGSGVGLPSGW